MRRAAVIDVVGLSPSLIGPATPAMAEFARQGVTMSVAPAFPAVTCTAQAAYVTGRTPAEHGIVGNGWYDRALAEVQFWKQSDHLVRAPKIWEDLRSQQGFTCAKLFWWYNMYSQADYAITPRPMYPADGRKIFDIYTWPYSIRPQIKADLGEFPFPAFWGPIAGRHAAGFQPEAVSRWIAESAKWVERKYEPTLSLVYLPHLDYNLQRLGPKPDAIRDDLQRIDAIVGDLLAFFRGRGVEVMLLSEYGISAVSKPVHLNRYFRERGWLAIKEELGLELMDCGASRVFAVADHQIAHVYLNDTSLGNEVSQCLTGIDGVEQVLGGPSRAAVGLNHERAGDLIAVAAPDAWFTYYYWLDDQRAPDFARTVDIHRKPGYDPVELFLDPGQKAVQLKIAWRMLQKKLGFRMLMDVVPLDASLVKGSHGRVPVDSAEWPVLICRRAPAVAQVPLKATDIYGVIRDCVL